MRIKNGSASFEDMAAVWSMGGESVTKGDIGWIATGALLPEMERELRKHKKGDVFKVWTKSGVHIVRKTDVKQDNGFALMMRIVFMKQQRNIRLIVVRNRFGIIDTLYFAGGPKVI
jgi:parvulin-like peptidyl-prolyl isomerase